MRERRRFLQGASGDLPGALLLAGFLFLVACRIFLFGRAAEESIVAAVAHSDAAILGILLFVYGAASLVESAGGPAWPRFSRYLARVLRVLALVVVAVYAADLIAYRYFNTRLYWIDVLEFSGERRAGWSMLLAGMEIVVGREPMWRLVPGVAVLAAGFGVSLLFILGPTRMRSRWAGGVAVGGLALLWVSSLPLPRHWYHYGDKILFEDLLTRNLVYSGGEPYSAEFEEDLLERYEETSVCEAGRRERPTVVLVLVEGLSSYHSEFFSGLNDLTPTFDSIAREARAFTRFHANGWTTRGGLIALLTGRVPMVDADVTRNQWGSATFEEFYVSGSIPEVMNRAGYTTWFLTTGDLSFTNKGDWLESLGFDFVEGHDQPYYDGFPRGSFGAAPDSALFQRALQILDADAEAPRLLVLETVSSHQPFSAPDGSPDSEASVLRYVDRQLGWFVRRLEAEHRDRDLLTIIVGDHRAMTPFSRTELDRLGLAASALVPMVVSWDRLPSPRVHGAPFQQIDLLPSIAQVVGEEFCHSADGGLFLKDPTEPARLIMHTRGDDRDLLYVRVDGEEGLVRIDGDDTRIEAGPFSDPEWVVDEVNYRRLTKSHPGFSVTVR